MKKIFVPSPRLRVGTALVLTMALTPLLSLWNVSQAKPGHHAPAYGYRRRPTPGRRPAPPRRPTPPRRPDRRDDRNRYDRRDNDRNRYDRRDNDRDRYDRRDNDRNRSDRDNPFSRYRRP